MAWLSCDNITLHSACFCSLAGVVFYCYRRHIFRTRPTTVSLLFRVDCSFLVVSFSSYLTSWLSFPSHTNFAICYYTLLFFFLFHTNSQTFILNHCHPFLFLFLLFYSIFHIFFDLGVSLLYLLVFFLSLHISFSFIGPAFFIRHS